MQYQLSPGRSCDIGRTPVTIHPPLDPLQDPHHWFAHFVGGVCDAICHHSQSWAVNEHFFTEMNVQERISPVDQNSGWPKYVMWRNSLKYRLVLKQNWDVRYTEP